MLANGSLSGTQSGEDVIRRNLVEAELVDCIVSLPTQLFYSTQIPVSLWFITRNRRGPRPRLGEVLFIDARKLGHLTDRTHRDLSDADIERVASVYREWRRGTARPADVPGFCRGATIEEIRKNEHVLTPARYVGTEEVIEEGEPFESRMSQLAGALAEQFDESDRLQADIRERLKFFL